MCLSKLPVHFSSASVYDAISGCMVCLAQCVPMYTNVSIDMFMSTVQASLGLLAKDTVDWIFFLLIGRLNIAPKALSGYPWVAGQPVMSWLERLRVSSAAIGFQYFAHITYAYMWKPIWVLQKKFHRIRSSVHPGNGQLVLYFTG